MANEGNSYVLLNYEYPDNNSSFQTSMYRLVQIDKDGTRKIHGIKVVAGQSTSSKLYIYPNPSLNGQLTVGFGNTNEKDITLVNVQGKVVKVWNSFRNNSLLVRDLESGMYVVQVVDKTTGERKS